MALVIKLRARIKELEKENEELLVKINELQDQIIQNNDEKIERLNFDFNRMKRAVLYGPLPGTVWDLNPPSSFERKLMGMDEEFPLK